jgi:hypothetical protein
MKCRCGSSRWVFDAVAQTYECLNCNWGDVLRGSAMDDLCAIGSSYEDPGNAQCQAAVRAHYDAGRRCSRPASGWGNYCQQHEYERGLGAAMERLEWHDPGPGAFGSTAQRIYADALRRAMSDAYMLRRETDRELWGPERVTDMQARANRIRNTTAHCDAGQVVYFCRREGFIKIGVTKDVGKRMAAIGKGGQMPPGMTVGPVELLATTPGGYQLESRLHDRFAHLRIPRTEWFRVAPELLRLVERYRRRAEAANTA